MYNPDDYYINEKVEKIKRNFDDQIRDILKEKNITMTELSEGCKSSNFKDFSKRFNNRKLNYTIRTMCKMADVLGYKVNIKFKKIKEDDYF